MNELDLLKTHWKKDQDYIKFKKEDIINMIHKSSSSIVKWIFIICCSEFIIFNAIGFLLSKDDTTSTSTAVNAFIDYGVEIIINIIILCFIYRFYKLFVSIKSTDNTTILLENIIAVRENANRYLQFNLICITLIMGASGFIAIIEKFTKEDTISQFIIPAIIISVFLILSILLFRSIFKLYYKYVYGILLKKLEKNYKDLTSIENA